ncbi:MAG: DUF4294 domain-containing protein [Bacteroidetes bacterium]|nr:DUF4294 domain-containing protein [Bacteroidota bacterium]
MKKLGMLFALLCSLYRPAPAQETPASSDTMYMVKLPEVDITDERKWANDTLRYRYNQMRYYVKSILPYLNAATRLFNEINTKFSDPNLGHAERKRFVHQKEDEMRLKFEDQVKQLNTTQGVLLIKLIARQTGLNIYKIIGDFKNPFEAMKWQAWARLNGHNINKRYDPTAEPDLEQIMRGLGYPLPVFYSTGETASSIH